MKSLVMESNTYISTDDWTRSSVLKVQGCDLGWTGVNKGTTLPLAPSYYVLFTHAQGSDTCHVAASFLLSLQIRLKIWEKIKIIMKRKQKSWDKATHNNPSQDWGWRGLKSKSNIPTIWESEQIKAQFMVRHELASICMVRDGGFDHVFCLYMAGVSVMRKATAGGNAREHFGFLFPFGKTENQS